jgi:hypothetical protein
MRMSYPTTAPRPTTSCDNCFGLSLGPAHAACADLELLRTYPARTGAAYEARDTVARCTYRCNACGAIWLKEIRSHGSNWLLMSKPILGTGSGAGSGSSATPRLHRPKP